MPSCGSIHRNVIGLTERPTKSNEQSSLRHSIIGGRRAPTCIHVRHRNASRCIAGSHRKQRASLPAVRLHGDSPHHVRAQRRLCCECHPGPVQLRGRSRAPSEGLGVQVSGAVRPGTGIGLLQRAEYLRRERDGRRPRYQHRSRFLRRTDPYIADMCMESTQRDRFVNWLTTSARHYTAQNREVVQ